VTVRHILLASASAGVLALGVYLFLEVRATPATADVPRPRKAARADDRPEGRPDEVAPAPVRSAPSAPSAPPQRSEPAPALSGADDAIAEELAKPNPKLDAVMAEANKAYDRGDLDDAKSIALKVIAKDPSNVRMLRIAVSAACMDGDSTEAQKHYQALPLPDREQMKVRCARYGVTFTP
jgi:hypothetical protein